MTAIMCMLINDHCNMTRIIDAFERQISSLDHEGALELGPIRNILEYLLDYPTHVHHPVEDLVYGKLKIRNPALAPDARRPGTGACGPRKADVAVRRGG